MTQLRMMIMMVICDDKFKNYLRTFGDSPCQLEPKYNIFELRSLYVLKVDILVLE